MSPSPPRPPPVSLARQAHTYQRQKDPKLETRVFEKETRDIRLDPMEDEPIRMATGVRERSKSRQALEAKAAAATGLQEAQQISAVAKHSVEALAREKVQREQYQKLETQYAAERKRATIKRRRGDEPTPVVAVPEPEPKRQVTKRYKGPQFTKRLAQPDLHAPRPPTNAARKQ